MEHIQKPWLLALVALVAILMVIAFLCVRRSRIRTQYLDKTILVCLTFNPKGGGDPIPHQIHGQITAIRDDGVMEIVKPDGDLFLLPFEAEWLEPAAPGVYRERSTGIELEDPDYLTYWSVDDAVPELIADRVQFGFRDFKKGKKPAKP